MTQESNTIMSALGSALRSALVSHPHLCLERLKAMVADTSQINDSLREFRVRIWDQDEWSGYGIMSPHFADESDEPFYSGAFVTLDWLDRHALCTREEFDEAYTKVIIEQGSCEVVTLPSGEKSLKYYPITYDCIE